MHGLPGVARWWAASSDWNGADFRPAQNSPGTGGRRPPRRYAPVTVVAAPPELAHGSYPPATPVDNCRHGVAWQSALTRFACRVHLAPWLACGDPAIQVDLGFITALFSFS